MYLVDFTVRYLIGNMAKSYDYDFRFLVITLLSLVAGGYSDWTVWTVCSVTCGRGYQTRHRTCASPKPSNGGQNCTFLGYPDEEIVCNKNACPRKNFFTFV